MSEMNRNAGEYTQLKLDNAVDSALTAAKARNLKAARALLDLGNAELAEDGTVKGLAEQIRKLAEAEDSKFMFEASDGKPKLRGAKAGEDGIDDGDKPVDTSKMSYDELCKYLADNPEAEL